MPRKAERGVYRSQTGIAAGIPAATEAKSIERATSNSKTCAEREERIGAVQHADPGYQADGKLADWEVVDAAVTPAVSGMLAMAAGASGTARVAALLQKGEPEMRNFAADLLTKAKPSQGDQALMDMAQLACDKCLKIGGLTVDEKEDVGKARDHLRKAGAVPIEDSTKHDDSSVVVCNDRLDTVKVLRVIATVLGKRGRAHQRLMDVAHDCLAELTGGVICEGAAKLGARHSSETMQHLDTAHGHLTAAGARCDASDTAGSSMLNAEDVPESEAAAGKAVRPRDLAKTLAGERAEKALLVEVLGEIIPMLERLTKRVDDIARTPLPPLTIAKGTASVSKQQDRLASTARGDAPLSSAAIASALAKMTKEEQTLLLIKASYANPIRVTGSAVDEPASFTK